MSLLCNFVGYDFSVIISNGSHCCYDYGVIISNRSHCCYDFSVIISNGSHCCYDFSVIISNGSHCCYDFSPLVKRVLRNFDRSQLEKECEFWQAPCGNNFYITNRRLITKFKKIKVGKKCPILNIYRIIYCLLSYNVKMLPPSLPSVV